MRSKSTANMKAQTHGRLLGSQSFMSFSGASFMVAYFPVLEWQALGLEETSPADTCIPLRGEPWSQRPSHWVAELEAARVSITPP